MTSVKDRENNRQINAVVERVERKHGTSSGAVMAGANNLVLSTPKIPQPKIDANDRRQIEAQNEDKSRTTKEALDDIKRIHYKEKKKKEQNNSETYQTGVHPEGWVSRTSL